MKQNYPVSGVENTVDTDAGPVSEVDLKAASHLRKPTESSSPVRWKLAVIPCLVALLTAMAMIQFRASDTMFAVIGVLFIAVVGTWLCTFLFASLKVADKAANIPLTAGDGLDSRGKLVAAIRRAESEAMGAVGRISDSFQALSPNDGRSIGIRGCANADRAERADGTRETDLSNGTSVYPESMDNDVPCGDIQAASDGGCVSAEGTEQTKGTVRVADMLAAEVAQTAEVIRNLEHDSGTISRSLEALRITAERTNSLALNVAMEAVQAGDQGHAIAATAQEAWRLAEVSKEAIAKIQLLLERLQKTSVMVERITTHGPSPTRGSARQAMRAAKALRNIRQSVSSIKQMSERIEAAVQQQRLIVTNIKRGVQVPGSGAMSTELVDQPWKGA